MGNKVFGVNISEVVAAYNASGTTSEGQYFSIQYRKVDGSLGAKAKVRRYGGRGHLNPETKIARSIEKRETDAMKFFLIEEGAARPFEIYICLCVRWNGLLINHLY